MRIRKIRDTLILAKKSDGFVLKKKLIAQIVLDGSTKRTATELIQTFIDAGEVVEFQKDKEFCLDYVGKITESI